VNIKKARKITEPLRRINKKSWLNIVFLHWFYDVS